MKYELQAIANPHTRECSMDDLKALHSSARNPETAKFYEQVMRGLEIHQSGLDMGGVKVEPTTRQPAFAPTAKPGLLQ